MIALFIIVTLVQGDDAADHHFGISRSDGGRWRNQKLDIPVLAVGALIASIRYPR